MKKTKQLIATQVVKEIAQEIPPQPRYGVEFFHIYTDEIIDVRHKEGLESLRQVQESWSFEFDKIVLIDDYNPTTHTTTADDVLQYLESESMLPQFWAYESDMIDNAEALLLSIPDCKLKRSYQKYIEKNKKYPCSLLTTTWYLTRLGHFDYSVIRSTSPTQEYVPPHRLFNFLPEDYKPIEDRAIELIQESPYHLSADNIQDLFYPISAGRALELF